MRVFLRDLVLLACLALPASSIIYIVSQSKLFRPLREWLYDHIEKLGELLRCPLCFGFWTSLGFVLCFGPRPFHTGYWLVDLLAAVFALHWLSVALTGVLFRLCTGEPIMPLPTYEEDDNE